MPRPAARWRRHGRRFSAIGAAAARHAPPSTRDPPDWRRSAWNRRWPDRRAACSPTTSAAAVTCAIMKPEFSPGRGVRNAGSPDSEGSTSIAMRRSASAPISHSASASLSAANATGSAWKLPPDSASPSSAKTSGLSETAFASIASVAAAWRSRSRPPPSPAAGSAGSTGPARGRRRRVRRADGAARHQRAQRGGGLDLPVMAAQRMDARDRTACPTPGRIGRQARPSPAPPGTDARPRTGRPAPGRRELRAVQQRQSFLRPELSGARPARASAVARPASARRRITPRRRRSCRRAYAPAAPGRRMRRPNPGRDHRHHVALQHRLQQRERRRPHAGSACAEARDLQRHHQADDAAAASARRRRRHATARDCAAARARSPASMCTLASLPKPVLMP